MDFLKVRLNIFNFKIFSGNLTSKARVLVLVFFKQNFYIDARNYIVSRISRVSLSHKVSFSSQNCFETTFQIYKFFQIKISSSNVSFYILMLIMYINVYKTQDVPENLNPNGYRLPQNAYVTLKHRST